MGSSALAPPQLVDVTLALFAGTKLDITPSDCPEGISPDTQDGIYLPGGWMSRPCLRRLYAAGKLTPGTSVLYEKSYIQPNDDALTLLLTSDGKLWVEDLNNTPLNPIELTTVPAGLYAQSVSANGREYIAFSDLLHGQAIPLQYDGTNLDRVTQDGPGAGPTMANYQPNPATIVGAGSAATIIAGPSGIVFVDPIVIGPFSYYRRAQITTAAPHGFSLNQNIVIAGSTSTPDINGARTVFAVDSPTVFRVTAVTLQSSAVDGGAGTVTPTGLVRASNVVTAETTSAHGFEVGWQVQISGVTNSDIGGGIASISRDGNGVVTVTTAGPHGLAVGGQSAAPGSTIAIAGVTNPDASFDGTFAVASVSSPTVFTYLQNGLVEASSAGTGNVQDIWNAIAFIQAVPSATTFSYQQIGPPDAQGGGTATIIGQISPGPHSLVTIFLTRNGALTAPSPPVQFIANGGQQGLLTDIAIGPSNIVARLIGATGAGGDNYFTLPAVPQVGRQIVGTWLVIPDNTSTSAIIDFADNTLFDGLAIDQVGNDLFDQRVLGPVLGFFAYASRLMCWGDYTKIENFVNIGFDGGYLAGAPLAPLGWTINCALGTGAANGELLASTYGFAWVIWGGGANPQGSISQSAYQDAYGAAICQPNTIYDVRLVAGTAPGYTGDLLVTLSSASTGFTTSAIIPLATLPNNFDTFIAPVRIGLTPPVIPADLILTISGLNIGAGQFVTVDELELIPEVDPYNKTLVHCSYVENPEGFAQTTGNLGAADDDSQVQCLALLRKSALLETHDGVHIFQDNAGEPDTWEVDELTRAVGAVSLRGGDPGKFGTGDAAEDWAVIASKNGAYLFAGGEFWKVSQEISRGSLPQSQDPRPTWDDINWAASETIVAKNDPAKRRAYFALPLNGATQPNYIAVLDYREMDTATQIASAAPVHITIQGKMKSSDLTRKWSWWNIAANDLEILVRPGNQRELFIAGGVRNNAAYGNIYSLDPGLLTDDDYGQFFPYYTTYAFTDHDQEQALGLGSDLHLYKHIHAFIAGVGQVLITPIRNSLYNFQPSLSPRALALDTNAGNFQANDLEWSGLSIRGQRVFFRIWVQPFPGATDVQIRLQKFVLGMMKDPVVQFRQSGV